LFELVREIIGPIPGIGELTVYDTAVRIGARFQLEPDRVYLHAGTRDGAKALLDVDGPREAIERDELPAQLRVLSPREIEDLLCIYKDALRASRAGAGRRPAAGRGCS
jgi:hypothetical protein